MPRRRACPDRPGTGHEVSTLCKLGDHLWGARMAATSVRPWPPAVLLPEPQAHGKTSSEPGPQKESTSPEKVCPRVPEPFCSASGPELPGALLGPQNGGRAREGCRPEAPGVAAP